MSSSSSVPCRGCECICVVNNGWDIEQTSQNTNHQWDALTLLLPYQYMSNRRSTVLTGTRPRLWDDRSSIGEWCVDTCASNLGLKPWIKLVTLILAIGKLTLSGNCEPLCSVHSWFNFPFFLPFSSLPSFSFIIWLPVLLFGYTLAEEGLQDKMYSSVHEVFLLQQYSTSCSNTDSSNWTCVIVHMCPMTFVIASDKSACNCDVIKSQQIPYQTSVDDWSSQSFISCMNLGMI